MEEEDDTSAKTAVVPVVLFHGYRKWHAGNIEIHQDFVFHDFQTILRQLTGISYDNLTTYLVDNRKSKFPITASFNFAVIARPMNCHFMVVLKQPRIDCNRGDDFDLSRIHRNQLDMNKSQVSDYSPYHYHDRMQDLLVQRDKYLNMILNSRYGYDSPLNVNFPKIKEMCPKVESRVDRTMCGDCTVAQKQGKTDEFHICVYDEVILDFFRSPAGPISRRR
ncbi:hypothetical protein LXL04_032823 [Taraxacum kok-saghyz]